MSPIEKVTDSLYRYNQLYKKKKGFSLQSQCKEFLISFLIYFLLSGCIIYIGIKTNGNLKIALRLFSLGACFLIFSIWERNTKGEQDAGLSRKIPKPEEYRELIFDTKMQLKQDFCNISVVQKEVQLKFYKKHNGRTGQIETECEISTKDNQPFYCSLYGTRGPTVTKRIILSTDGSEPRTVTAQRTFIQVALFPKTTSWTFLIRDVQDVTLLKTKLEMFAGRVACLTLASFLDAQCDSCNFQTYPKINKEEIEKRVFSEKALSVYFQKTDDILQELESIICHQQNYIGANPPLIETGKE